MQKYYKYQYRFNASHSMNNKIENKHQHTFTVCLYVSHINQEDAMMFYDFDNVAKCYFENFEHKYLNACEQFVEKVPNIENMGDVFFDELKDILMEIGVRLHQLDIFENITSIYQVSERIHLPAMHEKDIEKMLV